MDWKSGEVNAKYYAIQMLALLGAGPKSFLKAELIMPPPPTPPPPPPHTIESLEDCVAKAKPCKMANYVSFSAKNRDCSWYKGCNLTSTFNPTGDYESEEIKGSAVGTTGHACCGVTSQGGDCDKDPSGAWAAGGGYSPPSGPPFFALPYIVHEQDNAKGMLLIAKTPDGAEVTLTKAPNGTTALVLEGFGSEPGFSPPTEKVVGADGKLSIGPYGVALVSYPATK